MSERCNWPCRTEVGWSGGPREWCLWFRTSPTPVARGHAGTRALLLVADLDVRIITNDGELLRHLTLGPTQDHQPRGRPQDAGAS